MAIKLLGEKEIWVTRNALEIELLFVLKGEKKLFMLFLMLFKGELKSCDFTHELFHYFMRDLTEKNVPTLCHRLGRNQGILVHYWWVRDDLEISTVSFDTCVLCSEI